MFDKKNVQRKPQMLWTLVALVIIAALVLSACGSAQQAKVYHVGILSGLDAFSPAVDGFKAKMAELGYVDGKNIIYDLQKTNVDMDAYTNIAKKFVADKVDMIFVFPTEATAVAKAVTQGTNIPVVFTLSFTDVKGIDLINSVREPGGNITGIRFPSVDIASKRLQFLLELVPNAKRILVPYLKDYPNVPGQIDVIGPQAQSAGVELIEFAAASPQDLQAEMDKRAAASEIGFDAILLIAEPLGITPPFYSILGKFSYEHKIPIGGALMEPDGNSSVFGLLPQAKVAGEQAALLADKIFKGTPAGTIPVGTSDSYFQINYKAAQALGVTVPEGLLKQANEVIR
jgi:putative tryptophan/tyrosine transport system substrate-binding protein